MKHERSASPDRESAAPYAAPHPAQRLRSAPRRLHATVFIGLAALTLVVGVIALQLPQINGAAIWWPAAGTGTLMALLYRGRIVVPLAVIAATALAANLLAERAFPYALLAAVIVVVETIIVIAIVGRRGQRARLDNLRGLGCFLLACASGALVVAIFGATALMTIGDVPWLQTALALLMSHGSALLLMVAIALVPFSRRPLRIRPLRVLEGAAQFTITLSVAAIIFSPLLPVPMLFILFPLLAWAAARFRPLYVVVQLAAIALLVPLLNLLLGGPYRDVNGIPQAGLLVQLFMICAAITTLFLAVGRSEREALVSDRERRAAVLRGGFIGAQVGFLVLQRGVDGELHIVEANDVGRGMAHGGWLEPLIERWLAHPDHDLTQEMTLANGRSYQVFASLAGRDDDDGDAPAAGVQLVEITDTIAARDALARTLERERAVTLELRELARQKDVFVSAVSHELRTPITSILGFAEEVNDNGPPETKQAAEVIIRNSQRLATMVDQLLELGRVATVPTTVSIEGVDLCTLMDNTIEEQRRIADRAGVRIEIDDHDEHEVIVGMDALALGRVLTNLLSNAIKFTPEGGIVAVSCDTVSGRALINIDDSGMGIPADEREKVFERFFRSSDQTKLAVPGTGLGLPIVKALVEACGGSVSVLDSPLGGTRMTIDLPLVAGRRIAARTPRTPETTAVAATAAD
ncbi:MAG: ATP-binding protein [Microcella sp.]